MANEILGNGNCRGTGLRMGLACVCVLALAACQSPDDAGRRFLESLRTTDEVLSSIDFEEGQRGGLKVGKGWSRASRKSVVQRWTPVSWAARNATIYFSTSWVRPRELRLRCAAYEYEGSPPQSFVLALNGLEVAERSLEPGYREVRIPIPAERQKLGINTLELRFDHAGKRYDRTFGEDARPRAAACESIELASVDDDSVVVQGSASDSPLSQPRQAASSQRAHVFLYLIDTLRADALGIYGAVRDTSPRIEEFARDSVVFRRAWSSSSWTLPSTMTALTGVYPSRHGYLQSTSKPENAAAHQLLSEHLGNLGYETMAVSQSYVVSEHYDFDRGFDSFYLNDALSRASEESGEIQWFLWHHLEHRPDTGQPLFAFFHTVDPHHPYNPQGEDEQFAHENPGSLKDWQYQPSYFANNGLIDNVDEVKHMRALYDGDVAHADRQFGSFIDLLKHLGLYRDSLIVLIADHGEEFGEHGSFGHGHTLFEEQVHIPFLIKYPGLRGAGSSVETRVSLADVAPTVLEVAGGDLGDLDFDGASLVRPTDLDSNRAMVAEVVSKTGRQMALATGNAKCLYDELATPEVFRAFDLAADPGEQKALAPGSEIATQCLKSLQRLLELDSSEQFLSPEVELSEEVKSQLRALGYVD